MPRIPRRKRASALAALMLALAQLACGSELDYTGPIAEWREYGGDKGGGRHSPLTQITKANVRQLEIAWEYRTGDVAEPSDESPVGSSFQATPILVRDTLYLCSPFGRVIALDPTSGEERWAFDPEVKRDGAYLLNCRGVSYWFDAQVPDGGACRERIFVGTIDARMIALDARTGLACEGFGTGGTIDLAEGIGHRRPGEYGVTSPPVLVGDKLVTGAMVLDNIRVDAPGGVVRAYDAHSGRLRWSWDPLPPGVRFIERLDASGALVRYRRGTANAWSVFSVDPERNLVFVPTGNTAPDYFGGQRDGLDYYSSSVVALDASTGDVVWRFQTVHHDVWDYDVPAQPVLFDYPSPSGAIPALVQATKMGHLYFLDRETGKPIFEVEERPVPGGGAPGEVLSPTQPFPSRPLSVHPETLRPEDAFGLTFWDRGRCRDQIEELGHRGIYSPPSVEGFIQYPGFFGGINWGSVSIDPVRGLLVTNVTRVAAVVRLIPRDEYRAAMAEAEKRGRKPPPYEAQVGTPFAVTREPLVSPLRLPCSPPPWGTLVGIDIASGELRWESTLGTIRDLAPIPLPIGWGTPNMGGPFTTASGLIFIAAASDDYLRAFDSETGKELWKGRLPAGGQATPMTYRVGRKGKQYVVVAAGGHAFMRTTLGDSVVAFALP